MEAGVEVPGPEDKRYFRHDLTPRICLEHGLLDAKRRDDLLDLLSDRIVADYRVDPIGQEQAEGCLETARTLVFALIGDEEDDQQ